MKSRALLILSTLAALIPSAARAEDQVSLRLSWFISGYHAGYFLGKERGIYKNEGIDLTIGEGRGSVTTAKLVASKADMFGVSDSSSLMLGASKGLPIKSIISLQNSSDFGVLYSGARPIKNVSDLKGKSIAMSPGDALTQLFPAVLEANGLKRDDVRQVLIDPAGKTAALLEGKVDAMLSNVGMNGVMLEPKGVKTVRFGEFGVETIGLVVIANTDAIRENPDLVRRFVKASVLSWDLTRKDPDAAVQAVLNLKPNLSRDIVKKTVINFIELMDTPNTKGKPLGYGAPADWDHTYNLYKNFRDMNTAMKPTDFYTNDFIQQ